MTGEVNPFAIEWSPAAIAELRHDVARFALPSAPPGSGWSLGCDPDFLARFRTFWLDEYDWQASVAELNRYPQFKAEIDGIGIHFVRVEGEGDLPRPLLMTHGWPGSHYEFWGVIDRLTRPSAFGGEPADAFTLILPTLPGYGYSDAPPQPLGPKGVAALWNRLMTEVLGFDRYYAQGGDWGGVVTSFLGLDHGRNVAGIHLNMAGFRSDAAPQNDAEAAWAGRMAQAQMRQGAYGMLQVTRPMSLAYASAGNPLGQAAWILERFHHWADLREGNVESVFGLDHLATNVMLYVMNNSFPTSLWIYNGVAREGGTTLPQGVRCETPTAFAAFPLDGVQPAPPRSRVELLYNLIHYSEPATGGHFAAMEQPALFASDVLAWGRSLHERETLRSPRLDAGRES